MTAPDSLEHLPNHACYGRKIHDGYMRRGKKRKKKEKHSVICLPQTGTRAGEGNWVGSEERREDSVRTEKRENFWCVELYLLKRAKLGLKPMMCLSFKVTHTVYAIC